MKICKEVEETHVGPLIDFHGYVSSDGLVGTFYSLLLVGGERQNIGEFDKSPTSWELR